MNSNFTLTGGARIGRANATYPFATLSVNKDVLEINASVIGNLVFQPRDILSIEPYTAISGKGIRIQHRVEHYNPRVVFWTTKDPHSVIAQINETGFSDHLNDMTGTTDPAVAMRQAQGGFPFKKTPIVILGVLWNALILSDLIPFLLQKERNKFPFGYGVKAALGLLFATALLTLVSDGFRKILLKEGRTFNDIKKFVYFIMLICGMIILTFTTAGMAGVL